MSYKPVLNRYDLFDMEDPNTLIETWHAPYWEIKLGDKIVTKGKAYRIWQVVPNPYDQHANIQVNLVKEEVK